MKRPGQPDEARDEDQTTSCTVVYTIETPSYREFLNGDPRIQLTLKQMVACDPETVLLALQDESGESITIESVLEESALLSDVTALDDQSGEQTLYQVQLPATETTYWTWTRLGGVLLEGMGTQEGWTIRMRFPNRRAVFTYREHCKEQDIPFRLESIKTSEPSNNNYMTEPQAQLLDAAIDGGYFEIPRGTTMSDLATRFGISNQAASERLRRALTNILTHHPLLE